MPSASCFNANDAGNSNENNAKEGGGTVGRWKLKMELVVLLPK